MKKYIERNGQLEMVWGIEYELHFFKFTLFVRGTEDEMREYVTSEFGYVGRYSACTDKELVAVNTLHLPIYLASRE